MDADTGNLLHKFTRLSWDDLGQWVGDRILARGKAYQQDGCVTDLSTTVTGELLAWVAGTARYATRISFTSDDGLSSDCTCPYGYDCKHGVATVLEYLNCLKNNISVTEANPGDTRLQLFDRHLDGEGPDHHEQPANDYRAQANFILKKKSQAQLFELLIKITEQHPEIARDIVETETLHTGSGKELKQLIANLRHDIQEATAEPAWNDPWEAEETAPDFISIQKKLRVLLESGYADAVVDLGSELLERGFRLLEQGYDGDEMEMEFISCIEILVRALDSSSFWLPEKLIWAIEAVRNDPFNTCSAIEEYLYLSYPEDAWSTVADHLLALLQAFPKPKKKELDFSIQYKRKELVRWLIHALENGGRADEIIPLCEAEVSVTFSYEQLVGRLITAQRYDEAKTWIFAGIDRTVQNKRGIASGLVEKLVELHQVLENFDIITAIRVEQFVQHPCQNSFFKCRDAAAPLATWKAVRQFLFEYLEFGKAPWDQPGWPLPATGLHLPKIKPNMHPLLTNLIDLSMAENDPGQTLYWYERLKKSPQKGNWINHQEVAKIVQEIAPGLAISIWKEKAAEHIAMTKLSAYHEAAHYLRLVARVMAREQQQEAWAAYLQELRSSNSRKRRLMEILDSLDERPNLSKNLQLF